MPINSESINRKLYDLLSVRGYEPKPLDVEGKVTPVPEEAAVIKFDFIKDGENYGKVWASIDGARTLQIYYGDAVTDSPDDPSKGSEYDDTWTGLIKHLKNWAQRRQLGFDLRNENHLASDMARRKHSESLNESDISGLLAAARLNRSFIVTAQTAEGQTKKYRVKAQSANVAKEKFMKHHSMAKIIDVKEEGVSEDKYLLGRMKYEQMKNDIGEVIAKLYHQGVDGETIGEMGDRVAQHLGYEPSDPIYRQAWSMAFTDANLEGDLDEPSDDEYTRRSMRQGELGLMPMREGMAGGLSWSSLDEGLSIEDKMSIFEEYYTKGNLTESIDEDKKSYFVSLFKMSDVPTKNNKYIVVPLSLVGNKILQLDKPKYITYIGKSQGQLVFKSSQGELRYPSETMRDISVFNTFTFSTQEAYDKFRVALSLKFDTELPNINLVKKGINEMDKSAPQPGRDGKVSHSTYGSRDRDDNDDYFKGKEAPGKAITAKQAQKDALDILKKQGVAEGSTKVDMVGKKCNACKKGTYQETKVDDDMRGTLHCTKCNKEVNRWQAPKQQGVAEGWDIRKDDIRQKIYKYEDLALAANKAGDDEKCKMYQKKIQSLKQKMAKGVTEGTDKLQGTPVVSLKDFDAKDTKKDKYGRAVPKKLKKDDPRVKFHKDDEQGVAEGKKKFTYMVDVPEGTGNYLVGNVLKFVANNDDEAKEIARKNQGRNLRRVIGYDNTIKVPMNSKEEPLSPWYAGVGGVPANTGPFNKKKQGVAEGSEQKFKVTYDIYGSNKEKPLYTNSRTVRANSEQEAINTLRKLVGGTNYRVEKQGVAEGQESMKQVNEGYYPMGKQGSYSDAVPTTKIILQHTRKIEEGEQRYRNIAKIFVENMNGERFLIPTTKPGIARVYARHIAEGGTPYDERGKHITSLVEEYQKMSGFVRATKGKQFNESAQQLVNEGANHYQSLRETLHKMCGHRGYMAYFESYTPTLVEDGEEQSNLNELFVQETLDPRIESVMPILSRLQKKVSEMKETNELAEWADNLLGETQSEENITEETLDEAADVPIQVRSLYAQTYAKYAKIASAAKGAKQMAYAAVEKKFGKEMAEKLKAYHNSNLDEELDEDMAEGFAGYQAYRRSKVGNTRRTSQREREFTGEPGKFNKEGIRIGKDGHPVIKSKAYKDWLKQQGGEKEQDMVEDLDANQKRVGQLGPTEKVGKKGAVGKLVGGESAEPKDEMLEDIAQIIKLSGINR